MSSVQQKYELAVTSQYSSCDCIKCTEFSVLARANVWTLLF